MRMRKTMFSALLIFAMLISVFTFGGGKVYADQRTFTNVQISPDGVLTWDPVDDVVKTYLSAQHEYEISVYNGNGGWCGTTYASSGCSCNVVSLLTTARARDGEYPIELRARDSSGNDYIWTGSYSFVNPNKITDMPSVYNIRWEGDCLSWDFDQSASSETYPTFYINIWVPGYGSGGKKDFHMGYIYTTEHSINTNGFVVSGTHDYRVEIKTMAALDNKSYRDSLPSVQNFYGKTFEPANVTGIKYEDGILTWDAFPNADQYKVFVSYMLENQFISNSEIINSIGFDLAKYLGEGLKAREIDICVVPQKRDANRRSYYYDLVTLTSVSFDYEFNGYSLSVFGKRLDYSIDLDDVLGDGGSIKYIPTEKKVIIDELTNEDLADLNGNVFDKNAPMFSTDDSLTIEGSAAVKLKGAFVDMGLDLTFALDSSFKIISDDSFAIKSRNIWFQGGSYTFKGKGSGILSASHYITISDGTKKLEVESSTSDRAVKCGFENPDGKITIPDSMKIYIPSNGRLSVNLKNIMTEDSHIASRVFISTTAPSPTPTSKPAATPTSASTSKPVSNPTAAPTSKPGATSAPVATAKPAGVTTTTPAPTAVPAEKKSQIFSFVERLYSCVLGREPEADGAAYWSDELYGFRRTGAEVAQGFIFSEEFENRKTSNEQFVSILYKTFFNRDPDEDGMNYWLSQLSAGTMDRVTVANGFIYSQEWADTCASYGIRSGDDLKPTGKIAPTDLTYAFVERMYTTAMKRGYDEEGKQYWASELANFNVTGEFVGAAFFLSEEMSGYGLSNEEYLGRLYATFMNREPDADGASYWLGLLDSGTQRADVVFGFTRSPEFTEKCIEARILPY